MNEVKELFPTLTPSLDRITAQFEQRSAALIPVLHACQRKFGHISTEVEEEVSRYLGVPRAQVHEVLSFYTLLSDKPLGRHRVQVCRTLSCMLLGAEDVTRRLQECLGIEKSGDTSPDGKVTLEEVECLGACELAPMMRVDDRYEGPLTPDSAEKIVKELK